MGPGARALTLTLATVVVLVIVFAVMATCALVVQSLGNYVKYSAKTAPRAKVSEAYPHLKTGDLLLFASTVNHPFNTGFTQMFYCHCGVVLREGPLIYISESQQAGDDTMPASQRAGALYQTRDGASVNPMLTRLKYYNGCVYVLRLSRALDPAREEALKATADRLHAVGCAYPTTAQMAREALRLGRSGGRHCFQHVSYLLDEHGLAPLGQGAPLAGAGPIQASRNICGIAGRALPDGYYYEDPVQLIYDIDTLSFGDPGAGEVA